ncbi:MAG: DUF4012 domain-containing protein, partial [Candidatus Liptonbacteria bacterium]
MKKAPKKNIYNNLADIVVPSQNEQTERKPSRPMDGDAIAQFINSRERTRPAPKRGISITRLVLLFLGVAVFLFIAGGIYVYRTERATVENIAREAGKFYSFFNKGEPVEASAVQSGPAKTSGLGDVWETIKLFTKDFDAIKNFSSNSMELIAEMKDLEETWIPDALSGRGKELIAKLEKIQGSLHSIEEANRTLGENSALAERVLPLDSGSYLDVRVYVSRFSAGMDRFVAWMKEDRNHNIILLLENPSELRPGGGFQGSYAEIVMHKGSITNVTVHDINDADRLLDRKIIPPIPLQLEVRRFHAADGNWFFDFPESASTTLSLLESSGLYKNSNTSFEAAIGVSGKAVQDILTATGPITLPHNKVVSADNFLSVLQENVQNGQESGAEDPKLILDQFASALLNKTKELRASEMGTLYEKILASVSKNEIRLFARDPIFEGLIDEAGASGRAFTIPANWNGDYLAVVNANINGQKSDLFMEQKVVLETQLSDTSEVSHHITLTRTHTATSDQAWWYSATNQDYLQIYTTPTAALSYVDGGLQKTITPRAEYAREKYEVLPRVAQIQSTMEE